MTTLRIGIHPNNPTLTALSRTSFLQERLGGRADVRFVDVGPGPRSIDFIGANLVDVSGTGATPPIIGQAAGVPLVYIATSEARPLGGLVVAATSDIRSVKDLKGKRVALAVGSWLQQLVSVALDRAGLVWTDIVPLNLPDALARQALAAGDIDAWAAPANIEDAKLRFIAHTKDLISNRSVFFARRAFAEAQPELLDEIARALDDADHWIKTNPAEAARLLSTGPAPDVSTAAWERGVSDRPWGLQTISDAFLDEQQYTADLFHRFGTLARKINVREATLSRGVRLHKAA